MELSNWFWWVLIVVVFVIVFVAAFWALYMWWKRDDYTREKFAFTGFVALIGFATAGLGSLSTGKYIIIGLISVFLKPFGVTIPITMPLSLLEAALIFGIFGLLIYAYFQVFKHWDGQKSIAQQEQEEYCEPPSVWNDITLFFNWNRERRKKLAPYPGDAKQDSNILELPESLTWHERARQLWRLHHRAYLFEEDYNPDHHCWLGKEKNTGTWAMLACYHDQPMANEIQALKDYAQKIAINHKQTEIELIVALKNSSALKNGSVNSTEKLSACTLTLKYTCETELLENLVDFSDYFHDIRSRVERAKLIDSDLTWLDTYTPSSYCLKKEDTTPQTKTLEEFILNWLQDTTSRRQLAVLGEYGQGKSTASWLLCYRLIQQAETDPTVRIPILIELRGKTLRTLTPEDLLSIWARNYHIDPQALLHLHLAGRLLLIFEGFDEIDLSGDTEARVAHFRTLWRLNYKHAKLIITGRPNFFLDSHELQRSLGNKEETQTVYLAPFNLEQIEKSLRKVKSETRQEIIALAKKDPKFREVVARPALLYIVAILWEREKLSTRSDINSAVVIELFIQQTLRRQQTKQDGRPFMVLNSAERWYFMQGVAAYMLAKRLPNQIDTQQLAEAVQILVETIPDVVSKNVGAVGNEEYHPLRNEKRLAWSTRPQEIMEKINTDVRSCGLLVTDLSKDGTFKFAHKSYMEFLQARVIYDGYFTTERLNKVSGPSITSRWELGVADLQNSDEATGFLAELLKNHLPQQSASEENAVAKGLWNILVLRKLSIRHSVSSFLTQFILLSTHWWINQLIGRYGLENKQRIWAVNVVLIGFMLIFIFGIMLLLGIEGSINLGLLLAIILATGIESVIGSIYIRLYAGLFIFTLLIAGWLWYYALLVTVAIFYLTSVLLLTIDFSYDQKSTVFKRLNLWYRTCITLHVALETIEQVVGKGMTALLAKAEEKRRQPT